MGGAPYKFAKDGVSAPSNVPNFSAHVHSDSVPSKQTIGQTIAYNGAASGF